MSWVRALAACAQVTIDPAEPLFGICLAGPVNYSPGSTPGRGTRLLVTDRNIYAFLTRSAQLRKFVADLWQIARRFPRVHPVRHTSIDAMIATLWTQKSSK
jgi:hypothetical protein